MNFRKIGEKLINMDHIRIIGKIDPGSDKPNDGKFRIVLEFRDDQKSLSIPYDTPEVRDIHLANLEEMVLR